MQRRTGKSNPHIAPPTPGLPPSEIHASSDKPTSRLNQRSFGVTNRIWLIICLFIFIILFTRFILPSHTPDTYYSRHHSPSYAANLKPTNYLNASDEAGESPFDFCPTFGPGDELAQKYGALTISQSWLHLGSGARVQKVIHKALLGQPVTISVIGGSISSCHGAGDDPIAPDCYPSRFFTWWNSIFPHPASELTNGAMRRTNSEYFSFCNAHHLPDYTDLIILELDSDDKPDRSTLDNFELLVRSILLRPDFPAVIILGHFSPQVQQQHGFAGPDHWHSVVAQFYDVPHISTKSALYPPYIASPASIDNYFADPILANAHGHALLADILIAYIQSQICATWSAATGKAFEGGGGYLPVYYALGGGAEQLSSDAASAPATTYSLLIDTGSSNTWVGAGKAYTRTSTSTQTTDRVSVTYGSGSFSGTEFTDQVTVASGLVIPKQSIGVASRSEGFDGFDGILGIGPTDLTEGTLSPDTRSSIPTVTDNLFSQGTISSNLVAVSFEPTTSASAVTNGELSFGGTDSSKFTGSISFSPLTSTSPASEFWGIDQSITYGSTTILSETAGIVDTGTTLVLIASDAFSRYRSATGGVEDNNTGLLRLSTSQFNNLQSLSFTTGGTTFELTANAQAWPRSLNTAIGGTSNNVYLIVNDVGTPSGEGLDFINGFTFLERFYSVFDTANKRVGFATTSFTQATTN
ncbi:hypothetical protein EWM64_g2487 [Hericium alpestre]|uniref:Peptidase A1 domain-containing protein n=1 Tax=Hericium alpestre TaxID=135208 RepID=A0A4Z0A485_9AGAM|nr:hypothetical protein EWM64_g2487 [Hericium alpestre]